MARALFLDRDGVINEDYGYVNRVSECRFIDGIFDLVKEANRLGVLVFVLTNQSGIGRGYYTESDFHALMNWILGEFSSKNAVIHDYFFCPHHPVFAIGDYRRYCDCRKPSPGMFFRARDLYSVDLERSVMIGDRISDLRAAKLASVPVRWLFNTKTGAYDREEITGSFSRLSGITSQLKVTFNGSNCTSNPR